VTHLAVDPHGVSGEDLMRFQSLALVAALAASLFAAPALAQGTGSEGYFQIYNNTEGNIIVGFYTDDGTGWSQNWLGDAIGPDESARAEFTADTGSCDQVLRVGWLGEGDTEVLDEPISIDICAASNLYLDDNEIYYD
jgi:hypothetical protein